MLAGPTPGVQSAEGLLPLPFTNLSTPPTHLQLPIQEELLLLTVAFDLTYFSYKHDSRQIKYFFLFNFTGVVLFCFREMFLFIWLIGCFC